MWIRRSITIAALLFVAGVIGLFLFFVAAKGSANMAESLCFADLDAHPEYGGYQMSGDWLPPSFECTIRGNGLPDITVGHPMHAFAWLLGGTFVTVGYLGATAMGVRWLLTWTPRQPSA